MFENNSFEPGGLVASRRSFVDITDPAYDFYFL